MLPPRPGKTPSMAGADADPPRERKPKRATAQIGGLLDNKVRKDDPPLITLRPLTHPEHATAVDPP